MWNCTHFKHPTDEQLQLIDNQSETVCYLSPLNCVILCCLVGTKWLFK